MVFVWWLGQVGLRGGRIKSIRNNNNNINQTEAMMRQREIDDGDKTKNRERKMDEGRKREGKRR